jgi:NADP-dependent 3-hydroxy acid dehydrogenase YdfG
MQLKNKTIVITGGSDGLGYSLAKKCLTEGALVNIIGHDPEHVDQAVKKLGSSAKGFVADVTNYQQMQSVADQFATVDILINNAGIWIEGSILNNSETKIARALDVNLKGVIFSTKAFLSKLHKDEETHILNISSTSGLKGRDGQPVYVASKFGVHGFTEALKIDLAGTNIKVSGFYPGGMHTSIFAKAGTPKNNSDWMDPDKVAGIIVFMLQQDASMVMDQVILNKRKTQTSN